MLGEGRYSSDNAAPVLEWYALDLLGRGRFDLESIIRHGA